MKPPTDLGCGHQQAGTDQQTLKPVRGAASRVRAGGRWVFAIGVHAGNAWGRGPLGPRPL